MVAWPLASKGQRKVTKYPGPWCWGLQLKPPSWGVLPRHFSAGVVSAERAQWRQLQEEEVVRLKHLGVFCGTFHSHPQPGLTFPKTLGAGEPELGMKALPPLWNFWTTLAHHCCQVQLPLRKGHAADKLWNQLLTPLTFNKTIVTGKIFPHTL